MKDSMKNGKDVTAEKYIKRIQMIIPDFFIDLNKKKVEGYTKMDSSAIERIEGIKNKEEILGELKLSMDIENNVIINSEYYINDNVVLQKFTVSIKDEKRKNVKFSENGQNINKFT
jgi:hypothetical protein